MDDTIYELIDKYLKREMSAGESLNFEQEALNNPELRREIELTYRIKRSLIDRQQKLYKTSHWESRRRYKLAGFATIMSVAAVLAIGLFLIKPTLDTDMDNNVVAVANVNTARKLTEESEEAIAYAKKSISEGKDEIAIAEVTRLEEERVIPTLNDISDGQFIMSHTLEAKDADLLSRDAYELHWIKIQSLITLGKSEEAINDLENFVLIEGIYQHSADSLLTLIKQNIK